MLIDETEKKVYSRQGVVEDPDDMHIVYHGLGFEPNWSMMAMLSEILDVRKAKASVLSDQQMILDMVKSQMGFEAVNTLCVRAMLGAKAVLSSRAITKSAVGNLKDLQEIIDGGLSQKGPSELLHKASAAGILNVMDLALGLGASIYSDKEGYAIEEPDKTIRQAKMEAEEGDSFWQAMIEFGNDPDDIIEADAFRGDCGFEAVTNGQLKSLKKLVGASYDLQRLNGVSDSLLHVAAEGGHLDIANYLLDMGLPIDVKSPKGAQALFHACMQDQKGMASLLIERGANINGDGGGNVPLFAAIGLGSLDLASLLLEKGATYSLDKDGWTPEERPDGSFEESIKCLCFCPKGEEEAIKVLVESGRCTAEELEAALGEWKAAVDAEEEKEENKSDEEDADNEGKADE